MEKVKLACYQIKSFSLSFLFLIVSISLTAQLPNGWRGHERSGHYDEAGLLDVWPEGGPDLLWETLDAGRGFSSPVIVNDRLFITGMNDARDRETFSAYTLNGEKLYEVEYGSPWEGSYPETRTTPAIVGERAWVISGQGEVVCIGINNGDILWRVKGGEIFERETGRWGTAESPLVFDNKVIYTPGGDKTTMVALDAETGKTVWTSPPLGDHYSYVSPLLINHNGRRQIIAMTGENVIGVDPETGDIEWTFDDWGRSRGESIVTNTPLFSNGRLFFSNGYGQGSFMLELNNDASGVTLAWRNDDHGTHHGGFVLLDGVIYGSNWISNNQGNWVAVEWNTGETLYNESWNTKGSIITDGTMLYSYEERRGNVGLVRPNRYSFDVVSEFRLTGGHGPHWAHPVIHDGILYLRHGPLLRAYNIRN